jgi:hypothetical protein
MLPWHSDAGMRIAEELMNRDMGASLSLKLRLHRLSGGDQNRPWGRSALLSGRLEREPRARFPE